MLTTNYLFLFLFCVFLFLFVTFVCENSHEMAEMINIQIGQMGRFAMNQILLCTKIHFPRVYPRIVHIACEK